MNNIEDYIPFGHDNAIKRDHLCNILGMSDREIREHIEAARRHGVVIINLQDGAGYFRPTKKDYDLVQRQYKQQKSRALKILSGNKSCSKWLRTIEGQQEMEAL